VCAGIFFSRVSCGFACIWLSASVGDGLDLTDWQRLRWWWLSHWERRKEVLKFKNCDYQPLTGGSKASMQRDSSF
jgi:hypothetical protein